MLPLRTITLLVFCLYGFGVMGQNSIDVGPEFFQHQLTPDVLRDQGHRLTLDSVRQAHWVSRFVSAGNPYFTVGADPSNWWLHVHVINHLATPKTLILRLNRKNFDEFRLYLQHPGGRIDSLGNTGAHFQQDPRFSLMDGYYYAVTLLPGDNQIWAEAYNRIGSMHLGLSLHSPDSFARLSRRQVWFFGLFCGVMLLSLMFGFLLLAQYRDLVYLLFLIYIINVLMRESYNYSADFGIIPIFQRNATSMLIGATFGLFFRQFLRLWEHSIRLDRVVKAYAGLIVVLALAVWQLAMYQRGEILKNVFWVVDGINLFFAFLALVVAVSFFRVSVRARILFVAYLPLAFAFIAILLRNLNLVPNYPLISQAVMLGFILEVFVLTVGFVYWHRYLETERRLLELKLAMEQQEKQLAVHAAEQRVKDRIARDLHDDLAASISSIRILSDVAQRHIAPEMPEAASLLEKISRSAKSTVESLSDLIWAVKPNPDFLNDIADRMREYAGRILDAQNIDYQIDIPRNLPVLDLNLEVRRNAYLIFKEAVNNAVKYSKCRNLVISLQIQHGELRLMVRDDGIGFDPDAATSGHGLANMARRAGDIGATLSITSKSGWGTQIDLALAVDIP